jgi:hypothetical protein
MNKIPEMRLPGGSYSKLKEHIWFEKFDWVLFYLIFSKLSKILQWNLHLFLKIIYHRKILKKQYKKIR